jgi:hypothetical protein
MSNASCRGLASLVLGRCLVEKLALLGQINQVRMVWIRIPQRTVAVISNR